MLKELSKKRVTERQVLSLNELELVKAWGGANEDVCYVIRPTTNAGIRSAFQLAREKGVNIGFRGGGNSYGDAAINGEGILLDLRRMTRVLEWNPESGMVTVEPGVTIDQLWRYTIEDGWWVPVVTGTSKTTIGGCAAMNVHGKNAWQLGPIGEHIYEFDMMLSSGEIITCSREQNSDLFYAAIGGFGMLGCFTSITLKLKRIYSGLLKVEAHIGHNMGEMLTLIDEYAQRSDYIVGWADAFAKGKSLGRGQIHAAYYLPPDMDVYPQQTLRIDRQVPPEVFFGVMPANMMWVLMRPFWNNFGIFWRDKAKYWASWLGDGRVVYQPHASFHFLLDYIPNWKRAFGQGGLIQYQPFIPYEQAEEAFQNLLHLQHKQSIVNFLTVLKRHRPDPFLMTHSLDGFSIAMDFRITKRNRQQVVKLCREMDEIVLKAGGRFYFAKDSTLRPEIVQSYFGQETIERFRTLKEQYDPHQRLETNLWRRLFTS